MAVFLTIVAIILIIFFSGHNVTTEGFEPEKPEEPAPRKAADPRLLWLGIPAVVVAGLAVAWWVQ